MLQVAYFGGLRVSELVSLTWHQVIRRDSGEAQLSIVGKGNKDRQVLIPAAIAGPLFASRGDSPASAPVFSSVRRPGQPLTERAVNYIIKDAAERAGVNHAASVHWLRQAHASHAIDNGAPITRVSATLGHTDLKTTSIFACSAGRKFWSVSQDEVNEGGVPRPYTDIVTRRMPRRELVGTDPAPGARDPATAAAEKRTKGPRRD